MNPYPLQFRPVLKRTLWGGRRLGDPLGKPIGPESDYAESWEVVDHGQDQSIVDNGPLAGQTLAEVIAAHGSWLLGSGDTARIDSGGGAVDGPFPLLLKYLDCNRVLSVQVHPDDSFAAQMERPDRGKTEAWYIVATEPDSLVYAGLKQGVDRQALQQAIERGQAEQVLHSFRPHCGDVVFIPAGTVHALGAGLLVAEIQQSSDTTFRLFDWNRVDADGNARTLHVDQGVQVTDYESGPVVARHSDASLSGWQTVVECDKFALNLLERGEAEVGGDDGFHIVTVPRGEATLRFDKERLTLTTGASVLLPAAMSTCQIAVGDQSTVMEMHLPH